MTHPFPLTEGRSDPPLSQIGVLQSQALAARLASYPFDEIYVTQLRRTQETASTLCAVTGKEWTVEKNLVEIFMGEWEGGIYRKHIADKHPLTEKIFTEQRFDVIPGGESNSSVTTRAVKALEEIAALHEGKTIAVFTHSVVIANVLAFISKSEPFAFLGNDNASISEIVLAKQKWFLRRFNDTAHLEHLKHL
jgi:probable phosphoglycerate mutase